MRAEEILSLLADRSSLNQDTLLQLSSLTKEYPYFQTARLLYTLNLQAEKDTCFQSELRKMACYAGDRKKLFFQMEEEFFSSLNMDRLEKAEGDTLVDSPFELIDFFLTQKMGGISSTEKSNSITSGKSQVTTDYLTYLLSEETQKQDLEVIPMQHQETIDKFLEEDEKSPIKIEWKELPAGELPVLPELDTVDENSFFSETLAKIYLKQKKYAKALEIIRKLNLVYPEKNIYFADQIRFLEKLIINAKK